MRHVSSVNAPAKDQISSKGCWPYRLTNHIHPHFPLHFHSSAIYLAPSHTTPAAPWPPVPFTAAALVPCCCASPWAAAGGSGPRSSGHAWPRRRWHQRRWRASMRRCAAGPWRPLRRASCRRGGSWSWFPHWTRKRCHGAAWLVKRSFLLIQTCYVFPTRQVEKENWARRHHLLLMTCLKPKPNPHCFLRPTEKVFGREVLWRLETVYLVDIASDSSKQAQLEASYLLASRSLVKCLLVLFGLDPLRVSTLYPIDCDRERERHCIYTQLHWFYPHPCLLSSIIPTVVGWFPRFFLCQGLCQGTN